MIEALETFKKRLPVKTTKRGSCVIWGDKPNKYGVLKANRKAYLTHRISWFAVHGPIPDGMQICHKCDTPACVNPNHLFLGTNLDNIADRKAKGRYLGEWNGRAKLTAEQVQQIRELDKTKKYTRKELSTMFGISYYHIYDILNGVYWKSLKHKESVQ